MSFKIHCTKVIILGVLFFTAAKSIIAQTSCDPLLSNIPKDSLTFMVYGNTNNMANEVKEKIEKSLPSVLRDIINETEKFCLYSTKSELYDSYTLKFNLAQNSTNLNPDSLLKQFGFSIKDLQLPYIKLDGGNFKKGLFYINNSEFTLRIYTQIQPIDKDVRKEYNEISNKLKYANYDEKTALWERIDTLMKKDSALSVRFFNDLLESEKLNISGSSKGNVYDIKSVFSEDLNQSAVIIYLNAKKIREIPYHFYNIFKTDIYNINELVTKIAGLTGYYEDLWLNIKNTEDKFDITTISSLPKKQKLHQNLDKELCSYLPSQKTCGLCIFNMQPAELKSSLIKYFNNPDYNDKKQISSKFAIWAIDEKVLNSLGNGFITIMDGEIDRRNIPDFKVALKMNNKETARQLLDILINDANAITKIKDNCYMVVYDNLYEKKKINLVIEDDIWILGTQSFDELRTKINQDQFANLYPMLNNKSISQYLHIDPKVFSLKRIDFKYIESKSSLFGKNKIKTETSMILK